METILTIIMERAIVPVKENLTFDEKMELAKFSLLKVRGIEIDEETKINFDVLMLKKMGYNLYQKKQIAFN